MDVRNAQSPTLQFKQPELPSKNSKLLEIMCKICNESGDCNSV